jgi:hypothetical protein
MSASEPKGAEVVPPARRPSLLVTPRVSAGLRITARNSNGSGTSRAGENQSAPYRQPGPRRMGFAVEAEMDAMAHVKSLCWALRRVLGYPRSGHRSIDCQTDGAIWIEGGTIRGIEITWVTLSRPLICNRNFLRLKIGFMRCKSATAN